LPDLWKDHLNQDSVHEFALAVQSLYPVFAVDEFVQSVMDETWDGLELKARWRAITLSLGQYLPADYGAALDILSGVVDCYDGFVIHCLPDFVEVFGQGEAHWELSIAAMERFTPHASAEFAVRPFIINHEERMMAQMYAWAQHADEHVRRLASEGCRPALPWGQALKKYKEDPTPVLRILTQLRTDPSPYVRKSVANNLNDIAKTHPDVVTQLAQEWYGTHKHSDWIVKHGCRTLLKRGNRAVLALFGYDDTTSVSVEDFALQTPSVALGEDLNFSFVLCTQQATKVRLEYGIDYVKATGKHSRKIFQISESSLKGQQKKQYHKKHSFKDLSTRKHYPGPHAITLIVNGEQQGTLEFEVEPA